LIGSNPRPLWFAGVCGEVVPQRMSVKVPFVRLSPIFDPPTTVDHVGVVLFIVIESALAVLGTIIVAKGSNAALSNSLNFLCISGS
jgi:hypothetical protein